MKKPQNDIMKNLGLMTLSLFRKSTVLKGLTNSYD